jgi:hypothetical protein
MLASNWHSRAVEQGRSGLTRERVELVATWDDGRRLYCMMLRASGCRITAERSDDLRFLANSIAAVTMIAAIIAAWPVIKEWIR